MSTTDELLEEMLEDAEEYATPVTDDDLQFWIDEHLRVISIPKNGVVAGVEGDKNVNKIKFGMNRYYHGFDMSTFSGRILYSNAKGNKNYYNITDMQASGSAITFSWLVDADAVQYMGKTAFVVYLFKIQGSELRQKFYSTLATLNVLEGMEVDSAVPVEKQTDIIERMKEEISAYAEEVKKSLPADYTAMTEQVSSLKEDLGNKTKNLKQWNLIDISKVKEGYGYTNSIGYPPTLVAQTGYNAIDDIIPCEAGETYTVNWLYGAIGIYDSSIKRIQHIYIDSIPKTFVVPDGGCYITLFGGALRMTDIMLVKGDTLPKKYVPYDIFDIKTKEYTNLFGVKWCAFGDSLTDSATLASQTTGTKNYVDYVSKSLGLTVVNCGVGGTGYMKTENRFVNRVSTIPEDTELLTAFGSFNDYEYIESSLGAFGDSGTDTIYGCMESFFDSVFSRCPNIVVGVILPTKWGYLSPQKDSEASKKCDLYIKALKEIADYYDLPVLNLYNYSNLRPWDDVFAERYYKDDDGNGVANTVHPLDAAHKRFIAPKVEAFIKRIYQAY